MDHVEDTLSRIAEAVADGTPIDWETERRDPSAIAQLDAYRILEAIRTTHRSGDGPHAPTQPLPEGSPATSPDSLLKTWGQLEIRSMLGSGSFGEVYRAWDPMLEREVALKLLRSRSDREPEKGSRFLSEARRMAKVRHDNVVSVFGADVHDGRMGIWMDLLEGRTLEDVIRDNGTMGMREAIGVGIDLCRALAAVHAAGLVHRDVKASNVLRESGGRIVLLDFGTASVHAGDSVYLQASSVVGTPIYMAPEILGGATATPRSDIYAIGVLLYHAVSGAFPVEARDFEELRSNHYRGAVIPLRQRRPELSSTFVRVVHRAIATDPNERFAGAGELENALARAQETETKQSVHRSRKRRRLIPVAATFLLVAAIALVAILRPGTGPEITATMVCERDGSNFELDPGGSLQAGDRLALRVRSNDPLHVYVLNRDSEGVLTLLFPDEKVSPANPVPTGSTHHIPGGADGTPLGWGISSETSRESFLVVAARSPIDYLETDPDRLFLHPVPTAADGLAPSLAPSDEGSKSVSTLETLGASGKPTLLELGERCIELGGGSKAVWIWNVSFEGPGS